MKKSDDYHLRLWENTLLLKRRRDDPADKLKKNMKTIKVEGINGSGNKIWLAVTQNADGSWKHVERFKSESEADCWIKWA